MAVWWQRRSEAPTSSAIVRTLDVATAGALVVTAAMWATATPTDLWLYRGGLGLHAVLTLIMLVAAMTPGTIWRHVLALEPLRQLGVISYGGYLLHWPILLLLQQETSLQPLARFAVSLASTVPLALAMHRYIETPIRRADGSGRRLLLVIPATAVAALAIVGLAAMNQPDEAPIDFAQAERELAELTAAPPTAAPTTEPATSSTSAAAGSDG